MGVSEEPKIEHSGEPFPFLLGSDAIDHDFRFRSQFLSRRLRVLIDELHEIARNPAAERLVGQLRGGLLPNPEGFVVFITTQSDEPPRGCFDLS